MDDFKINRIDIKYEKRGCAKSREMDGLCHVKVLPWLSVAQAVKGSYDIRLGKAGEPVYNTGEGGMFIAPSDTLQTITHRASRESGVMEIRWIFLDAVINGKYSLDSLFEFPTVMPEDASEEMSALLDRLFLSDDICDAYGTYYAVIKLLLSVGVPKHTGGGDSLSRVTDYIYVNYSKELKISTLADVAYTSESNLYASFKKRFGISPIAYVNSYRLSLAAERLLSTDAHICDIAADVGFPDPLYFSRMFKKQYAVSPREYRRMNLSK